MRQSVVFHILVVILLTFVGCESDADIDISAERKTVLFAFVESGDKCMIHAYQSIFFTETSSKIPLGENTTIHITIDGKTRYTETMSRDATSIEFENLEIRPESKIVVVIDKDDEPSVYASSYVPVEPIATLLRSEEIEKGGKKYKNCTVKLVDGGLADNYYQLVARDTKTGTLIDDIEYLGRIFEESKASMINDDKGRGLFTNANMIGRVITLTCNVPIENLQGEIELELYHMTYEHYCYMQSVAIHKDYMLLPVFSQNGVYNNVVNGIGLVSGVGRCKIILP